jgi:transcription initiation factor TFIIB
MDAEYLKQKKLYEKLKVNDTCCVNPHCGSIDIIEHHSDGYISCRRCGLVFPGKVIDTVSEWRTFSNDSGDVNDPSRVGDPQNIFKDTDFTVSVKVGKKSSDIGVAKLVQGELQETKNEKQHLKNISDMKRVMDRMNLDQSVQDVAQRYYRDLFRKQVRVRSVQFAIAAIIYIVCREHHAPRSFKEISAEMQIAAEDIKKAYKVLESAFGLTLDQSSIKNFVERFCNILSVRHLINAVRHTVDAYNQLGLAKSRKPQTVVASVIWFVSEIAGNNDPSVRKVAIADLSDKTGVTIATIMGMQAELTAEKSRILPPDLLSSRLHVKKETKS